MIVDVIGWIGGKPILVYRKTRAVGMSCAFFFAVALAHVADAERAAGIR